MDFKTRQLMTGAILILITNRLPNTLVGTVLALTLFYFGINLIVKSATEEEEEEDISDEEFLDYTKEIEKEDS